MTINPLPWTIAHRMDGLKGKLSEILAEIGLLDRPVPPMALYRMEQMKDLLDHMIEKDKRRRAMEKIS